MAQQAYRILVVDDDLTILYLLEKMLNKHGYKTRTAESAVDALAILEQESIDLVLCDIAMPEIDGLEFLRRAHNLKPQIPVIIMTANPNLPNVKHALQEGALDFFEKPFDLDRIFQTISRYASRRLAGRVVSLRDRSILLIAPPDRLDKQVQQALLTTLANLRITATEAEALELAKNDPYDLIVYTLPASPSTSGFFAQILELLPEAKSICVAERYDSMQMQVLMDTPRIDTVMIKNNSFSESEFLVGIRKLFSTDVFGIEKYMAWGVEPVQHVTHHTDDRFKFIEKMSAYLERLGISPHFISRMENVADEFLSNALYNAPNDENGNFPYRSTDRTEGRACSEKEKSTLSYVYDGHYFGISMVDNFGTITKQEIFGGIKRCLNEQGSPLQQSGGAGLGLYLSFLTLNKFIINIQPGQKTEMIGLCDVRSSMKVFNLMDKSLSIFVRN